MLRRKSISQKLHLIFGLVLGVSALIGAVGVFGARSITATINAAASEALPRAEQAAGLSETAANMEVSVVSYLDYLTIDDDVEADIAQLEAALAERIRNIGNDKLAKRFAALSAEVEIAKAAHRVASAYAFKIGGSQYTLPRFLEHIAVVNAAYLRALNEAARFSVFDGVMVDPSQSEFAVWAKGFDAPDDDLAALITAYSAAEADMVTYVAENIVAKPETAESQFVRMQSRRTPKVQRALTALTDASLDRYTAAKATNDAALANLRAELKAFITAARDEQHAATSAMKQSVFNASARGDFTVIAVMIVFGLGFGIAGIAAVFTTRQIGRPLGELSGVISQLADGNSNITVPFKTRADEIGAIANAAETFRENGIAREALEREQIQLRERAEHERIERLEREHIAQRDVAQREVVAKAAEDKRIAQLNLVAEQERRIREAEQAQVVENLANGLRRLATGDLSALITDPFVKSYDQLRVDFNAAVVTLSETIRSISKSAGTINDNVVELTSTADDLSRRTERSAAALGETSVAVEELSGAVKSTAVSADEANTMVSKARSHAEKSHAIVAKAVTAMGAINESSTKISKIIGVIDDIAFQTNLLALNAGVEAARAGDAGRGFAVVASEVRALAQRSSDAAREINSLISESGVQVTTGVTLVDEVGDALQKIVASVSDISTHMSGIATSSRDQASGIGEIEKAVGELDGSTQQNAAMLEQTTAATHSLAQEANSLAQMVARFTVVVAPATRDRNLLAAG